MNTKAWLAPYTWEFVTAQNAVLCQAKSALHKPTSDGHEPAKALWESRHLEPMSLDEAVEICRPVGSSLTIGTVDPGATL